MSYKYIAKDTNGSILFTETSVKRAVDSVVTHLTAGCLVSLDGGETWEESKNPVYTVNRVMRGKSETSVMFSSDRATGFISLTKLQSNSKTPVMKKNKQINKGSEMTLKVCSKCNVEKHIDCFGNNTSGPARYDSNGDRYKRPECKECNSKATIGRRKARQSAGNPPTPPNGTPCDICGKAGTQRFPKLRFDHCQETLQHRGWLCDPCNRSLGVFNDSVGSLLKVINYLNKTEKKIIVIEQNGFLKLKE